MHPAEYLRLRNTRSASAYLSDRHGISRTAATLAKLRTIGGGPEFRKIGAHAVAYAEGDLDAWAARLISRPLRSTSEAA